MVKRAQTIRRQQPTNCLSVFDHFAGLALKRLRIYLVDGNKSTVFGGFVQVYYRNQPKTSLVQCVLSHGQLIIVHVDHLWQNVTLKRLWGSIWPPCGFSKNVSSTDTFLILSHSKSHISWKFYWNSSSRAEGMKTFSVNISCFNQCSIFFDFWHFLVTKKLVTSLIADDLSIFSVSTLPQKH